MKAFLMHPAEDFAPARELPANHEALIQDLELGTMLEAMAAGDPFLWEVAQRALLLGLRDPKAIVYRQQVLSDCLDNPGLVRELYDMAGEALTAQRRVWGFLQDSPSTILSRSVSKMEILIEYLRRLRRFCDEHGHVFRSPGFTQFFSMLAQELDEPYFQRMDDHLRELRFKSGKLFSARIGVGNRGADYVLHRPRQQGWLGRMLDRSGSSFTIPDRDTNGFKALSELEDRGLNTVANALAQAVDHVLSFLVTLRTEVGFYVACVNLRQRLAQIDQPTTLPVAAPAGDAALTATGLYDVCLSLTTEETVVANDIAADDASLVMITGANQGGKSTLLRSIGVAQLMMQAGMFVGAQSLKSNVCDGLFTHYKREEDQELESGKLDEELARMSDIADRITPTSVLLCNESFAATNEREGSQIARQVIDAMLEAKVKVVFVTHMFDLASSYYRQQRADALFLRAQRGTDGARPYKVTVGEPLPTSYGADSYERIFGSRPTADDAASFDHDRG
jgi:MutS domain V